MAGYDDGRVACTDREIILRRYYLLRPRRIDYQAIKQARRVPLVPGKKLRTHGTGDLVHWFNYDPDRARKDLALVIYLDGKTRPVITPDDPDQVTAELAAHGVTVTSGTEAGLYEKQWSDLSPRTRRLIVVASVAEACLILAALINIKRRPASQIRGPKQMWSALAFVQPIGPLLYFVYGRRRPPPA